MLRAGGSLSMTVRIRSVDYEHEGHALRGEFAWNDEWTTPRPCVVVVHDAMKTDQGFEEERAVTLAGMGYAGFALDVYGAGVKGTTNEDAYSLMKPFELDRDFLQARLRAGLEAAADLPEVDAYEMAAIGYCFGGMCVLDLARGNAPLVGVASFHGLLSAPSQSHATQSTRPIEPRVLVLHGWDDPLVPAELIEPFAQEMSERHADWQLVAYGGTMHSFSNMRYDMPEQGVAYHRDSERRSWQALTNFLAELFQETTPNV